MQTLPTIDEAVFVYQRTRQHAEDLGIQTKEVDFLKLAEAVAAEDGGTWGIRSAFVWELVLRTDKVLRNIRRVSKGAPCVR